MWFRCSCSSLAYHGQRGPRLALGLGDAAGSGLGDAAGSGLAVAACWSGASTLALSLATSPCRPDRISPMACVSDALVSAISLVTRASCSMPPLSSWLNAAIPDLILPVSERRAKTLSAHSTITAHLNTSQVRTSSAMTANSARERSAALAVNCRAFAKLACAIGTSEPTEPQPEAYSVHADRAVAPTQHPKTTRHYCSIAHQVSAPPSPRIGQAKVLIIGAPPRDPSASQRR